MTGRTWRPSLDDYDRSSDASPQARQERRHWTRVSYPPVLSAGGCWCGAPFGHDWDGKCDGAPHPRDWPGRVNGHPYRRGGEAA